MEPSQKYTLKGISGTEGKNYGRISCASRDAALLTVRIGGISTSSLYYVGKGMNGTPFVNHITGSAPSDISFYYDESYIYYNRKFGGHDSLSPVSATTGMDLDSVSVIPSESTPINIGSTNVFGYNTIEDLSTGVAGLMPNSFTNKMFSSYVNATYTPTSSGELHAIDPGGGTFFILVQLQGHDNDHMSFHIFQNAGLYVKTLNTITQVNYQNNTSINIEPASSGKPGFNIKLNYTSLYGKVQVHIFKLK